MDEILPSLNVDLRTMLGRGMCANGRLLSHATLKLEGRAGDLWSGVLTAAYWGSNAGTYLFRVCEVGHCIAKSPP